MITIIAAMAKNNAIGFQNKLIWHLPDDLKNFKKLTQHNVVIMGRKTFESIGKPLPNRVNIVVTSTLQSKDDAVKMVKNIPEAIELGKKFSEEIFIIGGAKIYKETLPFANKMEITMIEGIPENADAFFPEIDWGNWELIQEKSHKIDENHCVNFSYKTYKRKELATI